MKITTIGEAAKLIGKRIKLVATFKAIEIPFIAEVIDVRGRWGQFDIKVKWSDNPTSPEVWHDVTHRQIELV